MSTVLVDLPPEWVAADLDADPLGWARATVRRRAREQQVDLERERADRLADVFLPALESAHREDVPPALVLFLLPEAERSAVCSVTVRAEEVDPDVAAEDLLEQLRLPEEMLEQPAVEEIVETRCGPAVHLIQRYRSPQGVDFELVQEHELFLWHLADDDGEWAITLSTGYLDLVEAAEWRPSLRDLATSLTLTADQDSVL